MNRRQAMKASLHVAAVTALLGRRRLSAQTGAHELWVNPSIGGDNNSGSKAGPLRTLAEAARRVNQSTGESATTIVLTEGVHVIAETTTLKPSRRKYNKAARLSIRAEVLPDDPEWNVGRMPTLIHAIPLTPTWNGRPDPLGGAVNGLLVETSHVTIQGLKILGTPIVETPKAGQKRRLYAIARLNRELEDLEVAQCLFASDEVVAPNHVGVIAQGNGLVVHHCLFRGYMKDAVVYWTPNSRGHAMRHCFFHGMYSSTVWTSGISDDFEYRNNVVDGANYIWIYQSGASSRADAGGGPAKLSVPKASNHYMVVDCWFANNKKLTGTGTGAKVEFADVDSSFLEMVRTKVTDQPVVVGHDSTRRDYLHPATGSEAASIGAGLFMRPGA